MDTNIEHSLLLIVDVQNGFVSDRTSAVVPRIADLIRSGKFSNRAFTQFYNTDNSSYEKFMGWAGLKSEQSQMIDPRLSEFSNTVFKKTTYTAVTTEFKKLYRSK